MSWPISIRRILSVSQNGVINDSITAKDWIVYLKQHCIDANISLLENIESIGEEISKLIMDNVDFLCHVEDVSMLLSYRAPSEHGLPGRLEVHEDYYHGLTEIEEYCDSDSAEVIKKKNHAIERIANDFNGIIITDGGTVAYMPYPILGLAIGDDL